MKTVNAFIEFLLEVLSHNPVELHEHLQNREKYRSKLNYSVVKGTYVVCCHKCI